MQTKLYENKTKQQDIFSHPKKGNFKEWQIEVCSETSRRVGECFSFQKQMYPWWVVFWVTDSSTKQKQTSTKLGWWTTITTKWAPGCWTKNMGKKPKMDGEYNGKPYSNWWFGGFPIFLVQHPPSKNKSSKAIGAQQTCRVWKAGEVIFSTSTTDGPGDDVTATLLSGFHPSCLKMWWQIVRKRLHQ